MGIALWTVVAVMKLCWDSHYFDGYDAGLPPNAQVISEESRDAYRRVQFTYQGYRNKPVPALLTLPRSGDGPFPGLVFLHGIGQEKEFLDEVAPAFAEAGFALASFDQYMQGERKLRGASPLQMALAIRRRGALTVNEARRLVDYLETRPDIAKDRVYLIGASYGAMMGSIAAARDQRFRAAWLCYGGGDFGKLAGNAEARKILGKFAPVAGEFASWFMAPCEPTRYVGCISPRPILFQNGDKDRIVTPAAAKALFDAAKDPKEIKWYPSDHLDLDPEYIPIAVRDGLEWLRAQDAAFDAAR